MSDYGDVQLSSLEDLGSSIRSFKNNIQSVKYEIESDISKFFQHFDSQRRILIKRLEDTERALASAERELYRLMQIRRPIRDEEGDIIGWERPDCTMMQNHVMRLRHKRDLCADSVQRCNKIIDSCETRCKYHNGVYNMLEMNISSASRQLGFHIDDVIDYNKTSASHTSMSTSELNDTTLVTSTHEDKAEMAFYNETGTPMANVKITIVDNEAFGFGQIDINTDSKGCLTIPHRTTSDCSIYINEEEVYTGELHKGMVYKNGAFSHSDLDK